MTNAPQISTSVTPSIATTTDGTSTVTLLSVPFHDTTGGQAITFDVVGYDFVSSGGDIASAKISVRVKNVGGTLTMVGTPVHIVPIMAGSSTALQSAVLTAVVSGSNVNLNVIGVTGKTIKWVAYANSGIEVLNSWTAVPTPGDGYVNIWSAANTRWEPTTISSAVSGATIAGDVTGTLGASSVVKIQGTSVSATAPTNGQILQLVTGGWTPTTIGGDVTGSPSASTVAKIQGRAVNSIAPSDGEVLSWSTADAYWRPISVDGPFTAGGDLTGSSTVQTIISLTGQNLAGGSWPLNMDASNINGILTGAADKYTLITPVRNSTTGSSNSFLIIGQVNDNATNLNGGEINFQGGYAGNASKSGGNVIISSGDSSSRATGYVLINSKAASGSTGQIKLTTNELCLDVPTASTVGAAGGASALPATPTGYLKFTFSLGGTVYKIPYYAT